MKFELSEEVLNKVLNALAAMPYQQVATLIQEIQQDAKQIEAEPTVKAVAKEG